MSSTELRLVALCRPTEGKRSAACTILHLQDREQGTGTTVLHRGEAAGRQIAVVQSEAWFSADCSSDQRRKHISSFITLSSPGPHAFLLCVPVNQPVDGEDKALDVLTQLFGPAAVSHNTIVLFTHTEELEEDEQLGEYLLTWRKDLLELVERCGGRYHTLESSGGEEEEERRAVEELLKKVDEMVGQSGTQHVGCALYQEAGEGVRERQDQLVREGRETVTEEEMEAVRAEAERSVDHLDVDVDHIFSGTSVSPPPPPPPFLWGLWEKVRDWFKWLPQMVRREALFGALVGLFVGGPVGGVVGATVGSVATEMSRRKTQKTT
ncbi:GTPase IMAP family member 4 isoform X2 [Cynoglossus semilaevis]|uniref:GTPase IMAP family member 4 isoform X2 n=1 Tax=Cynoglossus semilaevis TaxID=244447 RepID=UPI0004955CA4|nr:GTPase IMAP family member 4-like isoform X2 [Cynoglossus semilaevis]